MHDFTGAKILLLCGSHLVTILNDDKDYLRDANLWDLPGGGREDDESPKECAIREVSKELHIKIKESDITYIKQYPSLYSPGSYAYFMVAAIEQSLVDAIVLGNEGQTWQTMTIDDYLNNPKAVHYCQDRIKEYLKEAALSN